MKRQTSSFLPEIKQLGPSYRESQSLDVMKFRYPYVGRVAMHDETGELDYWISASDENNEMRLLVARIEPEKKLSFSCGWSYGCITLGELMARPNAAEAIVEAAYHITAPDGSFSTDFHQVLPALHKFSASAYIAAA